MTNEPMNTGDRCLCKLWIKITTGGYPQITQITQINDDVNMVCLPLRLKYAA